MFYQCQLTQALIASACEKAMDPIIVHILIFICSGIGHWAMLGWGCCSLNTEQKHAPQDRQDTGICTEEA